VTLGLRRCADCGFAFADDPDVDGLLELYEGLVDPGYEESEEPRSIQMRRLVAEAIRQRPDAKTVLDVGAGTGLLVSEAAAAGLDATGVEPSSALVERAAERGTVLLQGALPHPSLIGRGFDIVFLVDVIEHVSDPVGLLQAAEAHLAEGGLLVVVTPDAASRAARILGKRWWHLRTAHVGYFTPPSLDLAAARAGLVAAHRGRARWYFEIGYLADRVAAYLSLGGLNRLARRVPLTRWLYRRVVRLDLRDSLATTFERPSSST
jgi:SAM-dependent methyltransferase